jgi:hypothetical protein
MATSKSKQSESMNAVDVAPASSRVLPLPYAEYTSQDYLAFMGTREEMISRLSEVPKNHRAIVIPFPDEASFKAYGPILWYLVKILPEVAERFRRSQIEVLEQLIDEFLLESPEGRTPNTRSGRENARSKPSGGIGGARKGGSKARTQK